MDSYKYVSSLNLNNTTVCITGITIHKVDQLYYSIKIPCIRLYIVLYVRINLSSPENSNFVIIFCNAG